MSRLLALLIFVNSFSSNAWAVPACSQDAQALEYARMGVIAFDENCFSSCRREYVAKVRQVDKHLGRTAITGGGTVVGAGGALVVAGALGAWGPMIAVTGPLMIVGALMLAIGAGAKNRLEVITNIEDFKSQFGRYMRVFLRRAQRINPSITREDITRMINESIDNNELCQPSGMRRPFAVRRFILDKIQNEASLERTEAVNIHDGPRSDGSVSPPAEATRPVPIRAEQR